MTVCSLSFSSLSILDFDKFYILYSDFKCFNSCSIFPARRHWSEIHLKYFTKCLATNFDKNYANFHSEHVTLTTCQVLLRSVAKWHFRMPFLEKMALFWPMAFKWHYGIFMAFSRFFEDFLVFYINWKIAIQ